MGSILVLDTWQFRHYAFHQYQLPFHRKAMVAILQDQAAARVVLIVNDTLEHDGVRDSWNRFKETTWQEAGAVTYAHAPQMNVRGLLASWKIENGRPDMRIFLGDRADEFA